jgi:hypothetical protein
VWFNDIWRKLALEFIAGIRVLKSAVRVERDVEATSRVTEKLWGDVDTACC